MSSAAWSNWHPLTVEGHANELAVLMEHAPEASMAEPCMSNGAPAVVAYEHGRLVAVWAGEWARPPVWSTGRVHVEAGVSATITAGRLRCQHVPVPFALAAQVLANSAGPDAFAD